MIDHSALIPCGSKPDIEKEAIRRLGDLLPELDVIWHVSAAYLKTVRTTCVREWSRHHPLPRLQASLERTINELLKTARMKSRICKPWKPSSSLRIKIHILAKTAYNRLRSEHREIVEELSRMYEITREDREVLALAIPAHGRVAGDSIYLVTKDRKLEEAALRVMRTLGVNVEVVKPSELAGVLSTNLP